MMTMEEKIAFLREDGDVLAKEEGRGWYVFLQVRTSREGYWVSYENKYGGASVHFDTAKAAFIAYAQTLAQLQSGNDSPWVTDGPLPKKGEEE